MRDARGEVFVRTARAQHGETRHLGKHPGGESVVVDPQALND